VKTWQGLSRRVDRPQATLQQYMDQSFRTSDQVLLCSFGPDLAAERTTRELRRALVAAGFLGPATAHLIRVSPLLDRSSRRCYRLRGSSRDGWKRGATNGMRHEIRFSSGFYGGLSGWGARNALPWQRFWARAGPGLVSVEERLTAPTCGWCRAAACTRPLSRSRAPNDLSQTLRAKHHRGPPLTGSLWAG